MHLLESKPVDFGGTPCKARSPVGLYTSGCVYWEALKNHGQRYSELRGVHKVCKGAVLGPF